MKLSSTDKKTLLKNGCLKDDFQQIEYAMNKSVTRYKISGNAITREQAIELLGRDVWLNGISRSAFHSSAVRTTTDGINVYFDSSAIFKNGGKR